MTMTGLTKSDRDDLIASLLQHCRLTRHAARASIIARGQPSDELLYIVSGSVAVMLEDEHGREIVLGYLNEGEFFGEIGLLTDSPNRTAYVRARSPCQVAHIAYGRLRGLPALFPDIIFLIACQLASRLLKTNRRLRDLAFMDVSGRIARTLLDLCKEPDAMTHPDGMQIRVTRQELGRIVGCSREVVGRVLKALAEQNLIFVKGKTIVVYGAR
jgi:CRP/FNR family cyclic AMP-dependent transcriptional regulator